MISKKVFLIILFTFITLITWVTFDILHNRAEVRPSPQVQPLLEPINPTFDQSAIDQL